MNTHPTHTEQCKRCDAPMVREWIAGRDTWWRCPICKDDLLVRILPGEVHTVSTTVSVRL